MRLIRAISKAIPARLGTFVATTFFLCCQAGMIWGEPIKDHPRLGLQAADIPSLQARMQSSNPVWVAFKSVVDTALADWQDNKVPDLDTGQFTGTGNPYASENYGMLFAFMALIETNPVMQQTYAQAAKECLMFAIDQSSLGPVFTNPTPPFRNPEFILGDRGFGTEGFAFMVDWLQYFPGLLSTDDLGKVRKAFLWWGREAENSVYFAPYNPNHIVNDPELLRLSPPATPFQIDTREQVRGALNNHYLNRLKMLVMMPLALDADDDVPTAPGDTDPPGALTGYIQGPGGADDWVYTNTGFLRSGTGSWLYLTDYALRHDGAGGDSQEGLEYMSNGLGPLALTMWMLHTAGQDDPHQWGTQVVLDGHPFWEKSITAYLQHLPPATRLVKDYEYRGPVYEPIWFGDGEQYAQNDQFIKILAPLGLYDFSRRGTSSSKIQAVRYIQQYLAQGGPSQIAYRIYNSYPDQRLRDAIYYFLLFDPSAPSATDPRSTMPLSEFVPFNTDGSMGELFSRTGNGPNDAMFDWRLGWEAIDHQHGDGNSFELWRNGVWLTKRWVGYGMIAGASDFNNALSIQNDPLPSEVSFNYHQSNHRHGSQFAYNGNSSQIVGKTLGKNFVYVSGDSTALYNLYGTPGLQGVEHASRSIVWLKPEYTVVYDRAATANSGRFKRFYLSLPEIPQINGNTMHVTVSDTHEVNGTLTSTPKAELFGTTLLPLGAQPTYTLRRQMTYDCQLPGGQVVDCDTPEADQCQYIQESTGRCECPPAPANDPGWVCPCHCTDQSASAEPSQARLRVDAPGDPAEARFLHVLQGSNAGTAYVPATLVESTAGSAFQGAAFADQAVLFPVMLDEAIQTTTYVVPTSVSGQLVTGLAANSVYYVTQQIDGPLRTVQIDTAPGGTPFVTDSGGVLVIGTIEPTNLSIAATDSLAAETAANSASFTVSRSGSTGADLTVHYSLSGSATNGLDYALLNGTLVIPANSPSAVLTITPTDDSTFEGEESVVVTLSSDPAYYVADGVGSAGAVIADDDPPAGGFLQFSSTSFGISENGGTAHVAVNRVGASSGAVSVMCSTTQGSASAASDFQSVSQTLTWNDGDIQPKSCDIQIIDDSLYEDDESLSVKLSGATGQSAIGTPSTAALTILEDDPAPVGQIVLSGSSFTIGEDAGQVQITVKRINGKGGPASVAFATMNGSATAGADFSGQSGILTWDNNQNFDQTIVIPITPDDQFEGASESFSLALSNNTIPLGAPASATVTILDDDPQPLEYDVGPGWDFATLGAVPWQSLVAGSIVRIHAEGSPYHEKFLLSSRGTADQPIQVIGVADANGNRPVIDGTNATTSASLHFVGSGLFTEANSLIGVARDSQDSDSFKPGFIEIRGLELRNVAGTFSDSQGQSQAYSDRAGAILIQGAEHVQVSDCVIHHAANGIIVESQNSEADTSRDITIAGNHLYANGWIGQYNGRNLQIDGVGAVVEANRLDPPANGSNSYNIEARAAGLIVRYNRVEGGLPQLQISDSRSATVRGDGGYDDAFVYGNTILHRDDNFCTIVHFGGDSGTIENYRQGSLYFFQNTAVIHSNVYAPLVFSMPTNDQTVDARNNIFYRNPDGASIYAPTLQMLATLGHAVLGHNWISSRWDAVGDVAYILGDQIVTTFPGFANEAAGDFRLTSSATARDQGGALNAATSAHPVTRQYVDIAGSEQRPSDAIPDHGAFEYGIVVPTPTKTFTSSPTDSPTITATRTHTSTQTPSQTPPLAASTDTPTPSVTSTQTHTATPSPSSTTTHTPTPSYSPSPSATATSAPANPVLGKPRLLLSSNPFSLKFKGAGIVPKPWVGVDPLANGIRIEVTDMDPIAVPGGAHPDGSGWKVNSRGTTWSYRDSSGSHGGIRRILIKDLSKSTPGMVKWSIVGRTEETVSLPTVDSILSTLVLGNDDEAIAIGWNPPSGPAPRCVGTSSTITCK